MLSCNAALLDGASLASCLAGVGHLLTRRQIAAKLARDPTFLYQASDASNAGARNRCQTGGLSHKHSLMGRM